MRRITGNAERKNPLNHDRKYTVEYWREKFDGLEAQLDKKVLINCLIEVDDKYDRVVWLHNCKNVQSGKASLLITKEVVEMLQVYVARKKGIKVCA